MKREPEFLHDLLNAMTMANGQIELMLVRLQQIAPTSPHPMNAELKTRLDKAKASMERSVKLISDRRSEVLDASEGDD